MLTIFKFKDFDDSLSMSQEAENPFCRDRIASPR